MNTSKYREEFLKELTSNKKVETKKMKKYTDSAEYTNSINNPSNAQSSIISFLVKDAIYQIENE